MKIGLLGLGKLGRAMADRMIDENVALTCWNRSEISAEILGRLQDCFEPSLEHIVAASDVLLFVVLNDAAALDVAARLCGEPIADKLIVNMGTVRPATARKLGEIFAAAGAFYLDAPVSGTSAIARDGKLLILCSGNPDLAGRIQDLFDVLGRRTFLLGPVGAGSTMKFALNLILSTYWEVLGEAMAIGKAGGLDVDQMLDIITDSPAALPIVAPKREHIAGRGGAVSVDLSRAAEELLLIEQTAREFAVPTPAASAAAAMMACATSAGYGKKDVAEFIQFWLTEIVTGRNASPPDQTSAG